MSRRYDMEDSAVFGFAFGVIQVIWWVFRSVILIGAILMLAGVLYGVGVIAWVDGFGSFPLRVCLRHATENLRRLLEGWE